MKARAWTLGLLVAAATGADAAPVRPVNPKASPEAIALLQHLHDMSGKGTMAGQHSAPLMASTRLVTAQRNTGRYPAVFGQDFGFDRPGSWDGIDFRQRIVDEAIARHKDGYVITLMWHAVRPTEDEPVTFRESIQAELTDAEWTELTTPGTKLNERWKSQVDVIAWHLKQLRHAKVPVLWRPYHEMNGAWFWWGHKPGDGGYKKLYRMLFERLTTFHGLDNLLWVYNANEVTEGQHPYATYYPGDDVVDVLATDVYRGGFAQADYEELLALAKDKPIALGEVGHPPTPEILKAQPRWTWFMVWGDLEGSRAGAELRATYASEEVVTRDELPWVKGR